MGACQPALADQQKRHEQQKHAGRRDDGMNWLDPPPRCRANGSSSTCDGSASGLRPSRSTWAAGARAGARETGVPPYPMVASAGAVVGIATGTGVASAGRPDEAASKAQENSRIDANRFRWPLAQRPSQHGFDSRQQAWHTRRQRMRVQVDDLIQNRGHLVSHERPASQQHLPGYAGQSPLVGVVIDFLRPCQWPVRATCNSACPLLPTRWSVACARPSSLKCRSRALGEIRLARDLQQKHVARFEIAVDHALVVRSPRAEATCLTTWTTASMGMRPTRRKRWSRSSPSRYSITR